MTIRSWDKTWTLGPATIPLAAPYVRQVYAQSGNNTPRAMRDQGIYRDNAYNMTDNQSWYDPIRLGLGTTQYETGVNALSAGVAYDTVISPAYADVIPKLLDKWRNSRFNAGVTIGEGRESAQMIYDRLKSIGHAAQAIRAGNLGGALRSIAHVSRSARQAASRHLEQGDISSAFLELVFGWSPLISDIYALADHIRLDPRGGWIRAGARNSTPSGHLSSTTYLSNSQLAVLNNERRLHLMVYVAQKPSGIERLGLTDPATILTQLKALSFVADWFLPITATLKSMHAVQAMPVVRCIETRIYKARSRVIVKAGTKCGPYTALTSGLARHDYVTMQRYVNSTLPSVWTIAAQIPQAILSKASHWDVDLYKISTGAALTHQRLMSLVR